MSQPLPSGGPTANSSKILNPRRRLKVGCEEEEGEGEGQGGDTGAQNGNGNGQKQAAAPSATDAEAADMLPKTSTRATRIKEMYEDPVEAFALSMIRDYLQKYGFTSALQAFDAEAKVRFANAPAPSVRCWYEMADHLQLTEMIKKNDALIAAQQHDAMNELMEGYEDPQKLLQKQREMKQRSLRQKGRNGNGNGGYEENETKPRVYQAMLELLLRQMVEDKATIVRASQQGFLDQDANGNLLNASWSSTMKDERVRRSRQRHRGKRHLDPLSHIPAPEEKRPLSALSWALDQESNERRHKSPKSMRHAKSMSALGRPKGGKKGKKQSVAELDRQLNRERQRMLERAKPSKGKGKSNGSTPDRGMRRRKSSVLGNRSAGPSVANSDYGSDEEAPDLDAFSLQRMKSSRSNRHWIPDNVRSRMLRRDLDIAKTNRIARAEFLDMLERGESKVDELTRCKAREKYGQKKPRCCALCEQQFVEINLPMRVSYKAIMDLRKSWGYGIEPNPNMARMPRCYDMVGLCVFCAQFFSSL